MPAALDCGRDRRARPAQAVDTGARSPPSIRSPVRYMSGRPSDELKVKTADKVAPLAQVSNPRSTSRPPQMTYGDRSSPPVAATAGWSPSG